MAKSPTQRWGEWAPATSTTAPLACFTRAGRDELLKDGFQLPGRGYIQDALVANLEPVTRYHFSHFLNLLWQPLLEHLHNVGSDQRATWTATLDLHKAALDTEIEGVLAGAHDDMDIDSWVAFIQATLRRLVEVTVPTTLILKLIWILVPHHVHPTRASVMHCLRSSSVAKLVGPVVGDTGESLGFG